MGSYSLMDTVSILQDEKSYGNEWWWQLHNNVSTFNATELYA